MGRWLIIEFSLLTSQSFCLFLVLRCYFLFGVGVSFMFVVFDVHNMFEIRILVAETVLNNESLYSFTLSQSKSYQNSLFRTR